MRISGRCGCVVMLVCALTLSLPAQENDNLVARGRNDENTVTTAHYSIHAAAPRDAAARGDAETSQEADAADEREPLRAVAREVGHRLEAYLDLYNRQFRFPLEELDERLTVRLFDVRDEYDAYLSDRIGEAPGDVVYLHYPDPGQRELVGYIGEDFPTEALIHHSFVQFLRAFIPDPPLWIREGFAVYFSQTRYDEGFQQAVYRENLTWLATLKEMQAGASSRPWIPWDDLLTMAPSDVQEHAESFYPQAWGLVSFLMHDDHREINRLAWDSITALDREYSLQENNQAVYRNAFRWEDPEQLERRFQEYVTSRRTFAEWVSTGVERYEQADLSGAERAMVEALRLRRDHHVPFYYLGLINYDREAYTTAAHYFQDALQHSESSAHILYALGVNAIADDRPEDAREFLESIPRERTELTTRAGELLRRLPGSGGAGSGGR